MGLHRLLRQMGHGQTVKETSASRTSAGQYGPSASRCPPAGPSTPSRPSTPPTRRRR